MENEFFKKDLQVFNSLFKVQTIQFSPKIESNVAFSELSSYDPQIHGNSIQFFTHYHAKIRYDNLKI
jgi:hypothetical protein